MIVVGILLLIWISPFVLIALFWARAMPIAFLLLIPISIFTTLITYGVKLRKRELKKNR